MDNTKTTFFVLGLVAHVLSAIALVLLFLATGAMTVFCAVAGALIGCGSVPARPGRPITLYIAFGVLMGFAFWICASAISQREFLALVLVLPLIGGAVWLLQQPSWPSAILNGRRGRAVPRSGGCGIPAS